MLGRTLIGFTLNLFDMNRYGVSVHVHLFCLKRHLQSSGCLTTILELCANGNEEIAHLAHRVAVKVID